MPERIILWIDYHATDCSCQPMIDHAQQGIGGVVQIEEHRPQGEGDRWFYDIHYEGGGMLRVLEAVQVYYSEGTA